MAALVINFIRPIAMMRRPPAIASIGARRRKGPCDIWMNDRAQIRRLESVSIVERVVGAGKAAADFETTGWRQL